MINALTARQTQILKMLIDEYIDSALPVGSEILEKKYNLGVSSATVRNEMVNLTKMGYLKQPHTSAGRIPTPLAMKFYVDQLMEERSMSLADEVRAKEEIASAGKNLEKLMVDATQALAEKANSLAVSALDDGRSWHAGLSHVFENPQSTDLELSSSIFSFLEESEKITDLFFKRLTGASSVEVIFGEDIGWPEFEPIGITTSHFKALGHNGVLGVVGPVRSRYPEVIPIVRYFGSLIAEAAK